VVVKYRVPVGLPAGEKKISVSYPSQFKSDTGATRE
jgi:hypothetical protein